MRRTETQRQDERRQAYDLCRTTTVRDAADILSAQLGRPISYASVSRWAAQYERENVTPVTPAPTPVPVTAEGEGDSVYDRVEALEDYLREKVRAAEGSRYYEDIRKHWHQLDEMFQAIKDLDLVASDDAYAREYYGYPDPDTDKEAAPFPYVGTSQAPVGTQGADYRLLSQLMDRKAHHGDTLRADTPLNESEMARFAVNSGTDRNAAYQVRVREGSRAFAYMRLRKFREAGLIKIEDGYMVTLIADEIPEWYREREALERKPVVMLHYGEAKTRSAGVPTTHLVTDDGRLLCRPSSFAAHIVGKIEAGKFGNSAHDCGRCKKKVEG